MLLDLKRTVLISRAVLFASCIVHFGDIAAI